MSSIKKSKPVDYVIIRAFGDEPVRLKAVAVRDRAVDVVGTDESMPMPLHLERAYRFEGVLFRDLRTAAAPTCDATSDS